MNNLFDPPIPNVSLVVWLRDLAPGFQEFVRGVRRILLETLEQLQISECFTEYEKRQLHSTILGLEGIWLGEKLFNFNFLNNDGKLRAMNIEGLLEFLACLSRARSPLLTVRFGGFARGSCNCRGEDLRPWDCNGPSGWHTFAKSPYEFSFVLSRGKVFVVGWPVVSEDEITSFPHCLYGLRRTVEEFGYLEKCHFQHKPHWKNDHIHYSVGTVRGISNVHQTTLETIMWDYLGTLEEVTVQIHASDLRMVLYKDATLKDIADEVPLEHAESRPGVVAAMYNRIPHTGLRASHGSVSR